MIMANIKSLLLTLIQYLSMVYIVLLVPLFSGNAITLGIQLLGIMMGIWSIIAMSKSRLNITPLPRVGSSFINGGPYRIIRHPMYLSLLLFFTPIVLYHYSNVGIMVFGIFLINLILKLTFEEQLLLQTFKRYEDYKQHTWRLIPLIY